MLQDRLKWNEKYRSGEYPDESAAIVTKYATLARGKKALDIAAGNGRNALFLAEQGFSVDAVDISDAGLNLFAAEHANIHPMQHWSIEPRIEVMLMFGRLDRGQTRL